MIVTIGTNDTLASPGAQLDYYQSLLDTMGRAAVDNFARLFVIPQAGHGLTGTVYAIDGAGKTIPTPAIANDYERFAYLVSWVERGAGPGEDVDRQGGRSVDAAVFVPAVSEIRERPAGTGGRLVHLRALTHRCPRAARSESPRHTSHLAQRLGRLDTQRPSRRCGARQHAHDRHDDGRDHRQDEEIRGQAVGAPREEQDETVAGDDAAAKLTTGTCEHAAEHVPGVGAERDTDSESRGCGAPRPRP